jgi:undecaprenyl-diphosphatase
LSAGICIRLFLGLIDKVGMLPFVIYRLLLGAVLIALLV